ncbi:MAG TPA: UDP-N-acetylmuramate dehydrogenase [Melioribacteraceae bacterium]|nr:UDP-N-acetylmuramate dehydrogenase [Melioribacteraceae bacterium]
MNIRENYPLKNLNTFGLDVYASYFIEIENEDQLFPFLESRYYKPDRFLVIGGGSNLLFKGNYEGTLLKYSVKGIKIIDESPDEIILESSGGELWDDLVAYTVEREYYGLENLTLIPGTVGAAPIQNIGAYGVELKDYFYYLEYINLETRSLKKIYKSDCRFGYRDSIFKNQLKNKSVITRVAFRLSKQKKLNLSYKSLYDELKNIPDKDLTIRTVRETVRKIRESRLPDPLVIGNAGSFFKNPEVSNEYYYSLIKKHPDIVAFKVNDSVYKISAGWLIEKCGYKGKRIGNVGSYGKQALIIVNYGGASGMEILNFVEKIMEDVKSNFGIELISEVNII